MEEPSDYQIRKDAREEALRIAARVHDRLDALQDLYNEHADRHAHAVIRILLTLNGGSAIALLAFASGLASRTTASFEKLSSITEQLSWFVYGVLVTCAAAFFAYLVAYMRAGQVVFFKRSFEHPFATPTTKSQRFFMASNVLQGLGVLCAIVGIALFAYGMFQVRKVINHLM
jgi:hypothetical protein